MSVALTAKEAFTASLKVLREKPQRTTEKAMPANQFPVPTLNISDIPIFIIPHNPIFAKTKPLLLLPKSDITLLCVSKKPLYSVSNISTKQKKRLSLP